jgi:cyclopropane fatty-acyl-phospholipid synthase-like methyltransferase
MQRPFSQACENNQAAILAVIKPLFASVDKVLEVGSGTGQHAVYFAGQMPHLQWQPADQQDYLDGIESWRAFAELPNILPPLVLDVNQPWPISSVPAIFSANTVHIMSWLEVEKFFAGLANVLQLGGVFCLYGPFNYQGRYSSDSNARFDQWLLQRNPLSAIRDFEAVDQLAQQAGMTLLADHAMPANNRCLVWQKQR